MEKGIERQLNIEKEKNQEIKKTRKEFGEWVESEIEENEPSVASQLRIIRDNQKKIPNGDFKLFEMYKAGDDLEWEHFEPLEKSILEDLQDGDKNNNARRLFYNYFSKKVRPRVIKAESQRERAGDNN